MKELSEAELIALARLAPKVDPLPEGQTKKGLRPYKDIRVTTFIETFNIKQGRNEVSIDILLEAFELWDLSGIDEKIFDKNIKKLFKTSGNGKIKLNMKPITIIELVKEKKNESQK